MSLHNETHRYNFKHHFKTKNNEKSQIKGLYKRIWLLSARIFDGQTDTVRENGEQDEFVEPGVENNLHHKNSESISGSTTTERCIGIILGLVRLDQLGEILLLNYRLCKLFVMPGHL